ncbi:TATA-binding protein-associated phosphoprotein [Entamoeba marina]
MSFLNINNSDDSNPLDSANRIKRESKNLEAIQQGCIIALLNSAGFSFLFKKPERTSVKTIQYFTIAEVYYNSEPLNVGKAVEDYCQKQFTLEFKSDMPQNQVKTIKRRRDLNRAALTFNWLMGYTEQVGYEVIKRKTKVARKTLKMDKIQEINYNGSHIITKENMNDIGLMMNQMILSNFDKNKKNYLLNAYDPHCSQIIQDGKNKLQFSYHDLAYYDIYETTSNGNPMFIEFESFKQNDYINY